MHETAHCIGYPSDSTRAARERGRGAACGHRLRRPGPVRPAGPPPPPSHPLAPVAQACLSLLWLDSGRRRASPTSHWSWVSSRAACRRAGSPARIATVVLVGCSGAGSGRGCRTWIAVCTVFSGARRRSEPALSCARIAGPSQCGGSPAPRGCASLGVTGLCAATQTPSAWHHCGCSLGQVGVRGVPACPMPGRGR